MGDHAHHQQAAAAAAATSSSPRFGIRSGGGEIVEVQGGHIVRSTGRKDRHSKVCTAKGPRDRRVRLSAHTAIQFYDVQDRLGYDRPSKAVDWLIKKAKAAIDELAELPAYKPTATAPAAPTRRRQQGNVEKEVKDGTKATTNTTTSTPNNNNDNSNSNINHQISFLHNVVDLGSGHNTSPGSFRKHEELLVGMRDLQADSNNINNNNNNNNPSFLPPSLDSDSIADTIRSFFPTGGASADTPSSSVQFPNYPPDLLSRTSSHSQDLRLSLQSFQDPMLLHHHHQQEPPSGVFPGSSLSFDATSAANAVWSSDHHSSSGDIGRFHRLPTWSNPGGSSSMGGGSGDGGGSAYMFAMPLAPTTVLQPLFGGQSQSFSQRGPLQSSNMPSVRAWIDPTTSASDHQIPQGIHIHPSAVSSGIGFASGSGFMGYHIPARIQGHELVEHDGILNKPSSASPDSRH